MQRACNAYPKLLSMSSQAPISQMVVARLDDMLPALWQADYPGNTTPWRRPGWIGFLAVRA
jgi:hypothetical protein